MKNKMNGQIRRNSDEIKTYSTEELSAKMYDYFVSNKDIENRINEFNKNFYYQFNNSLSFHLGRSMVKHCTPMDLVYWKTGIRNNGIMNDNDNDKTTIETLSIVNDFINAESKKAMKRILVYQDHEFNGKVFKNAPCYDTSIVCPAGQLENYKSLLFLKENQKCIISYYLDYISLFPVTLYEFEKVFFYFLTFLIEEEYPAKVQIIESLKFIKDINEIVKMRYIDISDRMILAFIHLISIDNELLGCCNVIYADIKHNDDLTRDQFENLAS